MRTPYLLSYPVKKNAIFLVALCAVLITARAQNTSESISQNISEKAQMQAQRALINTDRVKLNEDLAQQSQACYQKFAVTPCLNEVRDQYNEKMRDLKRQQVGLNDVQRKSMAADRVRALDERNSPEAQLNRAQARGKAMDSASRRDDSRAQRKAGRVGQQVEEAHTSRTEKESKQTRRTAPLVQRGKLRQQPATKTVPEQRPGQAAKMERSRQQNTEREKEAQLRREKLSEREAKRKKPAAAPLPVPLNTQ
jgi:colicin import membrane protein